MCVTCRYVLHIQHIQYCTKLCMYCTSAKIFPYRIYRWVCCGSTTACSGGTMHAVGMYSRSRGVLRSFFAISDHHSNFNRSVNENQKELKLAIWVVHPCFSEASNPCLHQSNPSCSPLLEAKPFDNEILTRHLLLGHGSGTRLSAVSAPRPLSLFRLPGVPFGPLFSQHIIPLTAF